MHGITNDHGRDGNEGNGYDGTDDASQYIVISLG
jgi:hypothetical protein